MTDTRASLTRFLLGAGIAALSSSASLAGPYETWNVELEGVLPFSDFDPWVADVWGYDANGRAYALVCQGNALRVVDVTDPALPVTASLVPSIGIDLKDVQTYGTYAYCVNQNGRMQVVDLSDPYLAFTAGLIGDFAGSHNCFIERQRGLLFICGHRNIEGFQVYDLNVDPVNPPLVGRYGNDYCHDVHVRGGLALVCAVADDYFELVDVSDLGNMQRISTFTHPPPVAPHSGWFTADLTHVLTADEETDGHLIAWNITNPAAPTPVGSFQSGTNTSIHDVHIVGDRAYLSYFSQGVRVLDVSDPTNMIEIGYIDSPLFDENACFEHEVFRGVWGVYPHTTAGNFYFGNMCGGGVYVARFIPPLVSVADPEAVGAADGPAIAALPGAPNPFTHSTAVPFVLDREAVIRARVLDLAGRVVSDLGSGWRSPGRHLVRWDGLGQSGAPAPAGVYWIQLEGAGTTATRRVVRSR
jgi:choice-of-anchor B domain-containing protein